MPRFTRRRFLAMSAALGAGVAAANLAPAQAATVYNGETVIDGYTVIRGQWDIDGLTIPAGAVLEFDPDTSTIIRSTGSIVCRGTLRQKPNTAAVEHRIQFVNVDESRFVGGSGGPDTDVGLWFYDMGMWDACGTERTSWNRTGVDASWLPGDELLTAPSGAGDFRTFAPYVGGTPPSYRGRPTEVFNLTRNVIVGGTPGHRAHVMFMMVMAPQMICHVRLEHCGPRQTDPAHPTRTLPVLGRYGLHFHKCGDATRSSLIKGVAVVGCGTRAFVPHASHGITFRDCVAYDTTGRAYWWDPDDNTTANANQTNDVLYDRCAAFKVGGHDKTDRIGEGKLSAWLLGQGTGNSAVDCVAAGVWSDGQPQTAGFYWDENANQEPNVWTVQDCVAHNNDVFGFFAWQNDPRFKKHHQVDGCVAWLNGEAGISHGAYTNDYAYRGGFLAGNGHGQDKGAQLVIHPGRHDMFDGLELDAAGATRSCVLVKNHQAAVAGDPLAVRGLSMTGHTDRAIRYDGKGKAGWIDWVECTVDGRDLEPSDFRIELINADEVIRVQRRDGSAYRLGPTGQATKIAPFA